MIAACEVRDDAAGLGRLCPGRVDVLDVDVLDDVYAICMSASPVALSNRSPSGGG